jgi:hypothetical protein
LQSFSLNLLPLRSAPNDSSICIGENWQFFGQPEKSPV